MANLLANGAFEQGPAHGGAADSWGRFGALGQEDWAKETGTNGIALYGWTPGNGGVLWQSVTLTNEDTNAQFYLRLRGRYEGGYTAAVDEVVFEFYHHDDATRITAVTNDLHVQMANNRNVWSSYYFAVAAPATTSRNFRIRPVVSYAGAVAPGGFQTFQYDTFILYDRTLNYRANEIVEEFSYEAPLEGESGYYNLDGKDRGHGFTNAWVESNPGSFTVADSSFPTFTNYPRHRGNKIKVTPPAGQNRTAYRSFPPSTTGRIYASAVMNYANSGAGIFAGISFMSNATEMAFFGKVGSDDRSLGLDSFGGGSVTASPSFLLNAGAGNDYLVFGMYDFSSRVFRTKAYYKTAVLPVVEPATWDAEATVAAGRIAWLNGIRIGAGGSSSPGDCYLDEVRVATNWYELMGLGDPAGIGLAITNFDVSVMRGSNPGAIAFSVTNVGGQVLDYDVTTNVAWITVAPVAGYLGHAEGASHTVSFDASARPVGLHTATITVTAPDASNSPGTVKINLTVTNIPAPGAVSVAADGNEMVRLGWTPPSGLDTLILHDDAPIVTDPSQGTAYAVGAAVGGATVLYKGAASSFEHVVAPGTTNHYAFYTLNNNYYSTPAVTGMVEMGLYLTNEIVESFAYTNAVSMSSPVKNGGHGFTNAWSVKAGSWSIVPNTGVVTFPDMSQYPPRRGNRIFLSNPGVNASGKVERGFVPVTNGYVYCATILSYQYESTRKFAGISFLSGGAETSFFGKVSDDVFSFTLGIDTYGSAKKFAAYDLRGIENSTGNIYLVVGRYDFAAKELRTIAYYRTVSVPPAEPSEWGATATVSGAGIPLIDGIRLHAGGDNGGAIGDAYFDEVRVATNWSGLFNLDLPEVVTTAITNIADTTAEAGGEIVSAGGSAVIARGLCWGTGTNPLLPGASSTNGSGTGLFGGTVTNLDPGGSYYVRAYAVNSAGTNYGAVSNFTALCFTSSVAGLYIDPTNAMDFTARWSGRSGALSYELDVATNSLFSAVHYVPGFSNLALAGTSQMVTGAQPGLVYYVRVRPVGLNCTGGNSVTGTVTVPSQPGPDLYGFNLSNTTNTDAQIRAGLNFTGMVQAAVRGVSNGVGTPYFAIYNATGAAAVASNKFATAPADGATAASALAETFGAVPQLLVTLGINTAQVGAVDRAGYSSVSNFTFTVVDDDTNGPQPGITGTNNILAAPGFESGCGTTWSSSGAGCEGWAPRNGSFGMAWYSWSAGASGSFQQDVAVSPTNGNVFRFTAWALAEANFTSSQHTAWMKLRFYTGAGAFAFEASNSVYGLLTSNRDTWVRCSIGATNVSPNIATVRVVVGYANVVAPGGGMAVKWDDGFLSQGSHLEIWHGTTNLTAATSDGTTNAVYTFSDAQMAAVTASVPLKLVFGGFETNDGLSRGATDSNNQTRIGIGPWVGNNVTNYKASASSTAGETTANGATSAWEFTAVDAAAVYGQTNWVSITLVDADNDRDQDGATVSNVQVGGIYVYDDDTNAPLRSDLFAHNLLTNSGFEAAGWWDGIADEWDGGHGNVFGNYYRADFRAHGGKFSATIPGQYGANVETFGGWYQEVTNAYGDGVSWRASVWALSDSGWTAGTIEAKLEFFNADFSVQLGNVTLGFANPSNGWTNVVVSGASPVGTVWTRLVLSAWGMGTNGSLYLDDASLVVVTNRARPMDVLVGSVSAYREGTGTNAAYHITDADMAALGVGNPLKFIFSAYDVQSGVDRSESYERLNYDIGSIGSDDLSDIFSTYSGALSDSDTTVATAKSVFAHTSNFTLGGTHTGLDFLETGDVVRLMGAGANEITVSSPDADNDRGVADEAWNYNHRYGYLFIDDDDSTGPVATLRYLGPTYEPGLIRTNGATDGDLRGSLDFAYEWVDPSGLFLTNASGVQTSDAKFGNVSMNWELKSPGGTQFGTNSIHAATSLFAIAGNGSIYATGVEYNVAFVDYASCELGTWTLQASAQDWDNDRGTITNGGHVVNWDRAIRTDMPMYFNVVDDDSNAASAYNLAINDRWLTSAVYDAELRTGFALRVRLGDDVSGVYTGGANGQYRAPSFSVRNPADDLVLTNMTFTSLEAGANVVNGGFEYARAGQPADSWENPTYSLFFRTNGEARSGSHSLGIRYTGTAGYSEQPYQWYSASNLFVGERLIYGAWLKIKGSLGSDSRALLKVEWHGNTNSSDFQGLEFGTFVTNTMDSWTNVELTVEKPNAASLWAKLFLEFTHVDHGIANAAEVYYDDVYAGSVTSVLARRSGLTIPYSNTLLGTYTFNWSGQDADNDRTNDTLLVTSSTTIRVSGGQFNVVDEDVDGPIAADLWVEGVDADLDQGVSDQKLLNGLWPLGFKLQDRSGILTNAADGWLPSYSMLNSLDVMVHDHIPFMAITEDGSPTNLAVYRAMPAVEFTNIVLGTWQVVWSAQDGDDDRPGDRGARTNSNLFVGSLGSNVFRVYDDDTNMPSTPSTVTVDRTWWTNVNLFNIAFNGSTDDVSGVYQYRYDTLPDPPQFATNGYVVSGIATSILVLPASNLSFETGYSGLVVPEDPVSTNHWMDWGSDFSFADWSNAEALDGTNSMRHVILPGEAGIISRYALAGNLVEIGNSNGYPVLASMSGWFKGNMSHAAQGWVGVAFLKMEFLNALTQRMTAVDNEWNLDHNGAPLTGVNATVWTNITITATSAPAGTRFVRFMTGIAQHNTDLPYTGYWDNISVTVRVVGPVGQTYSFQMTNALEGICTNRLFAVDDDWDRLDDRAKSDNTNFITMLDTTPPPVAVSVAATNGPDESSEVLLTWNAVPHAGSRASDGEPLAPWATYRIYYTTNANVTTNDAMLSSALPAYTNLGTNTTSSALITNLNFDTTYRIIMSSEDRVGNRSGISATATITTLSFILTQGLVNASSDIDLSWIASPGKSYDVLWEDGLGYTDAFSNLWTNVAGTIAGSWMTDAGATYRAPPRDMVNTLRFYRVSREGQWATNANPRRASREVYVAKTWQLAPGENWIALPFLPPTNRFRVKDVFGTNLLPSAALSVNATKITWYGPILAGTNAASSATNIIWLSNGNGWRFLYPPALAGQSADNWPVPTNEGFNIEIPVSSSTQKFVSVGRLPTHDMAMTIHGANGKTNYSVLSWGTPYRVKIKELGLIGASFSGGVNVARSDEIRIMDNSRGMASMSMPKMRIWRNGASTNFYLSPSGALANDYVIEPGEAIVIVRKRGPNLTWTNRLYYTPPGKNIDP